MEGMSMIAPNLSSRRLLPRSGIAQRSADDEGRIADDRREVGTSTCNCWSALPKLKLICTGNLFGGEAKTFQDLEVMLIPKNTTTSTLASTVQNHDTLKLVLGGGDLVDLKVLNHIARKSCTKTIVFLIPGVSA